AKLRTQRQADERYAVQLADSSPDDAQNLYTEAAGDWNLWIHSVQDGLKAGQPLKTEGADSPTMQAVDRAKQASSNLKAAVDKVAADRGLPDSGLNAVPEVAAEVIVGIANGLIDNYRERQQNQRDAEVKVLDGLRWRSYDELPIGGQ